MAGTPFNWRNEHYSRYLSAGGVVEISVCEASEDTLECHAAVLAHAIGDTDPSRLSRIAPVEIDELTFHGPWFDYKKQLLVASGDVPDIWDLGGFAFAFCRPPYGLRMTREQIQTTYLSLISNIAPRKQVKILSWQRESILQAAPWLKIGAEWWGVFAFSTYVKSTARSYGVVAATTD